VFLGWNDLEIGFLKKKKKTLPDFSATIVVGEIWAWRWHIVCIACFFLSLSKNKGWQQLIYPFKKLEKKPSSDPQTRACRPTYVARLFIIVAYACWAIGPRAWVFCFFTLNIYIYKKKIIEPVWIYSSDHRYEELSHNTRLLLFFLIVSFF
jgi:hypothetical protein